MLPDPLLELMSYCLRCYYKKKNAHLEKKIPYHETQFQRAPVVKTRLPPIPENPPSTPPQPSTRGSHRRVKRLRSDEEGLIDNARHTDTDMVDKSEGKVEDTLHEEPIKKSPYPRRKKAVQPADEKKVHKDPSDGCLPPKLPGAVSLTHKNADPNRDKLTVTREEPHTVLPPLQKVPTSLRGDQDGVGHTESATVAYDYYAEIQLTPIQRHSNQRLDSPGILRRKDVLPPVIGMTSMSKTDPPQSEDELTSFIDELDLHMDQVFKTHKTSKKTKPNTSKLLIPYMHYTIMSCVFPVGVVVMNRGFKEASTVQLLDLQRQLRPLSQYWYEIGLQVELPKSILKAIERISEKSAERGLQKVCHEWIGKESELTWQRVVEVLRAGELGQHTAEVADEIHKRFCQETSSGGTPDKSIDSDKSLTMVRENSTFMLCLYSVFFFNSALMTMQNVGMDSVQQCVWAYKYCLLHCLLLNIYDYFTAC